MTASSTWPPAEAEVESVGGEIGLGAEAEGKGCSTPGI